MNWNTPAEFFAMGGYALYVWGSFGACALALAIEPLMVGRRTAAALHNARLQARATQLDKETQA